MQRGEGSAGCPDVGWHGVTWGDALTFVPREMLTPFPTCSVVLGGGGEETMGTGTTLQEVMLLCIVWVRSLES